MQKAKYGDAKITICVMDFSWPMGPMVTQQQLPTPIQQLVGAQLQLKPLRSAVQQMDVR